MTNQEHLVLVHEGPPKIITSSNELKLFANVAGLALTAEEVIIQFALTQEHGS